MAAVIGISEDNSYIAIPDEIRNSGLYILGKPRMGKSWLIVSLILQDIKNGHGVFFIDPHEKAINDLVDRASFYDRVLLFDPENETKSFGINLLECPDIASTKHRQQTFTKAKGVSDKAWKNTFEEKPWLQLILQNTIYAFIENQGYTLAEFPLFFRDSAFRAFICNNIKHNEAVRDYWLQTFASKSKQTQQDQMEAAETRAIIMLSHEYVSDIVSQPKTTLNFSEFMLHKRVVLFRFSSRLSDEAKKIIGTIVVSELLQAIQNRTDNEQEQFSIFIDEFQTFAKFADFRFLSPNRPNMALRQP